MNYMLNYVVLFCCCFFGSLQANTFEFTLLASHTAIPNYEDPYNLIYPVKNVKTTRVKNPYNVIDEVNVAGVHQRIYFLNRLANYTKWPKLVFKSFLQQGDVDPVIGAIRHRLVLLQYLDVKYASNDEYTHELAQAISEFQLQHGLNPDGIIGPRTLGWINTSPAQRADLLLRNLNRQQAFFKKVESDYILINIPQFQLSLIEKGQNILNSKVIVGQRHRPTPTLNSEIKNLVLNPIWNVPRNILRKDLLPKIRNNENFLNEGNFEVYDYQGNQLNLKEFNWSKLALGFFPYTVRQNPGPENALGEIKLYFENQHSVYIHDTPDKDLFKYHRRAFSSGCVRVEKAHELSVWLAKKRIVDQSAWQRISTDSNENKWLKLKRPLPVHMVYWTAWVDANNHVQYRTDIYDKERVLLQDKKPSVGRLNYRNIIAKNAF